MRIFASEMPVPFPDRKETVIGMHVAGRDLRGLQSAAGIPPRIDELGRMTFVFPDVGEMRVVPLPGGKGFWAAIRVVLPDERHSSESWCQTWHGPLSSRNAVTIAGRSH